MRAFQLVGVGPVVQVGNEVQRSGAFDWAVHPDGARQLTSWEQLYPDALSQVWAVRFGLVGGPRARAVLTRFQQSHPGAHDPNALDLVDGATAPAGYWPGAGLALGLVDPGARERYRGGTVAAASATGRAWPYSVQTAADLVLVFAVSELELTERPSVTGGLAAVVTAGFNAKDVSTNTYATITAYKHDTASRQYRRVWSGRCGVPVLLMDVSYPFPELMQSPEKARRLWDAITPKLVENCTKFLSAQAG